MIGNSWKNARYVWKSDMDPKGGSLLRIAAYCRISTEKEDQINSFEAQQHYFRNCIEKKPDWELQGIYADEGISGTSTKGRTQFNRMIQAAREGRIDLIITKEVSRFARNTVDTLEYTRELRKRGIGVLFLNDNINTMDTDGELRLTIMSSIAQNESRMTSDRVKWGQRRCMERGVVFGSSLLGYDVAGGKISVNPQGAKAVRTIFHKYLNERKGSGVIARELQEEGIPSSRGNLKWTAPTVLKILKNEKYCGDLIQQKTYTPDYLSHEKKYNKGQLDFVVLRDHHEAIIDRATWDAVQREIARRHRGADSSAGHGNRYAFSGKIKCSHCGSTFLSRTRKSRTGDRYRVWRCGKATLEGKLHTDAQGVSAGCAVGRQLRNDTAADILKWALQSVQMDSEAIVRSLSSIVGEVLNSRQRGRKAEQRRLTQELEWEMEKKQRALEAFFRNTISESDLQFMNGRCDMRITQITTRIADLELQGEPNIRSAEEICTFIRDMVCAERVTEDFCGQLLHHMSVDRDGRVEVTLKLLSARWLYVPAALAECAR